MRTRNAELLLVLSFAVQIVSVHSATFLLFNHPAGALPSKNIKWTFFRLENRIQTTNVKTVKGTVNLDWWNTFLRILGLFRNKYGWYHNGWLAEIFIFVHLDLIHFLWVCLRHQPDAVFAVLTEFYAPNAVFGCFLPVEFSYCAASLRANDEQVLFGLQMVPLFAADNIPIIR